MACEYCARRKTQRPRAAGYQNTGGPAVTGSQSAATIRPMQPLPPSAPTSTSPAPLQSPAGHWGEVLKAFLLLGLTSFGGPVAHLGYFRAAFVERRRWLTEADYADLVALCQCLPGPTSSQVGIGLGLHRAGSAGALAAWVGFTAPSAVLMMLVALGVQHGTSPLAAGALHGLKVLAVAVVAQAVWAMARSLCPDWPRALLAVMAAVLVLTLPPAVGQVGALALGAVVGLGWLMSAPAPTTGSPVVPSDPKAPSRLDPQSSRPSASPVSRRMGLMALLLFLALMGALFLAAHGTGSRLWGALWVCYRASSLVFGGGHVVLPMLEAGMVQTGWMSAEQFLAGYGAAQAVPGPLFTFAAYLGATLSMPGVASPWLGALLLLTAIFAPAWLTLFAALPYWHALRQQPRVRNALAGLNAAVVGVLAAALITPVGSSAIQHPLDGAMAVAAMVLLMRLRWSPVILVLLMSAAGAGLTALGAA